MYYLLAVIIASIWGTTFVSTKVLLEHGLTPATIFLARFGIAYLGMAVVARHRWFCHSWRDEVKAMLAGIAGGSVYFLVENTALLYAPAGRVSLLVCTTPLVTAILAALWRREHQRRRLWIGSSIALFGVSFIVSDASGGGSNPMLGYMLALIASVLWAIYQLVCNPLTARYGAAMLTRKVFGYGLLTIIPFVLAIPDAQFGVLSTAMSDNVVILNVLYLGVVASLICYFLWSRVMSRLGSVVSANFIYLDPLSAYIFSYMVFAEPFTLPMLFGTVMVIGGIYLAVCPSRDENFVAMWQVPGTKCRYRLDKSNAKLCYPQQLAAEQSIRGFVFAPFVANADMPLCLIQQRSAPKVMDDLDDQGVLPLKVVPAAEDRAAYHEAFKSAIRHLCQECGVQKVVLARVQALDCVFDQDLQTRFFVRACQMYPDRSVALFGCRQTGFWLSVSPEILVAQTRDGAMETMALAGTMAATEAATEDYVWSQKNRDEQRFVADYIAEKLKTCADSVSASEPYTVKAGPVVHLRTDFKFTTTASLVQMAELLHPTPAVCGAPAEQACAVIAEAEPVSRRYYSGYFGAVGIEGVPSALYVTLRCAHFATDNTYLYAGGGILAASNEADEWDETCRKMQTLLDILPTE